MPESVTLVLLSDKPESAALPSQAVRLVASVDAGELVVRTIDGGAPVRRFRLPKDPYKIWHTDDDDWRVAAKWLQEVVGPDSVIVADYDHPLRDLLLYASAAFGVRYALRFTAAPKRFAGSIVYAVISNAEAVVFDSHEVAAEFHRHYFAPYVSAMSLGDLGEVLSGSSAAISEIKSESLVDQRDTSPVRVLIAAYFSGPCRTVGVQRPNYWFEELAGLSDGLIEPHIVSTTEWDESVPNVHVVPDYNVAALVETDGTYLAWAADFVASERADAKSFNTLSYYWRYGLEKYFDALDSHFDVVILSGNPFSCFDFAAYARRRWHARVILDYRDPFGNNPRFQYTDEAREQARYAERGYNFQADVISVVNDYCIGLVEGGSEAEIINIPNGFDERILESVRSLELPTDKINIVHAGSFTHDRSPQHILGALDPERHAFHHVGNVAGVDPKLLEKHDVVQHGRRPYNEALGVIGGADLGLVFLSEQNFETTTKLFDYLAMDIDVLLCTNGATGSGAVADVLEGVEGVFWCRNTKEDAERFIAGYEPSVRPPRTSGDRFTRRYGTRLLVEKILELAR